MAQLKANVPAAKPTKQPRIIPTSRINDLELVIAGLEERLAAAEMKLKSRIQPSTDLVHSVDISRIREAEEARMKAREVEQRERSAERREWDARGHELQAMSDVVAQLWETIRTSMATPPGPTAISSSAVPPPLVVNAPYEPRPKSLSPVEIRAQHHEDALAQEAEASPPGPAGLPGFPAVEDSHAPCRDAEELIEDFPMDGNGNGDVHDKLVSGSQGQGNSGDVEVANVPTNVDFAGAPTSHAMQGLVEIVKAVLETLPNMPSYRLETPSIAMDVDPNSAGQPPEELFTADETMIQDAPTPEAIAELAEDDPVGETRTEGKDSTPTAPGTPYPDEVPPHPTPEPSHDLQDPPAIPNGVPLVPAEDPVLHRARPQPDGTDGPLETTTSPSRLVLGRETATPDDGNDPEIATPIPSTGEQDATVMEPAGNTGVTNILVGEPQGPQDRQLRQRTPIDYRLMSNPQARGARTKPASRSNSAVPTIPAASLPAGSIAMDPKSSDFLLDPNMS